VFLEKYLSVFLLSTSVALFLTPWIIKIATRLGLVDLPSERRIHHSPIPRAGGIAVVVAFLSGCFWAFSLPEANLMRGNTDKEWLLSIIPALSLIFVTGLIDDAISISWPLKLAAQIVAAILLITEGIAFNSLQGITLAQPISYSATILWVVLFINAFNLIDGLDGLASGLAIISCLGLLSISLISFAPSDFLVILSLSGACLGFLRYNFSPAKIFLGDCGSMSIGFLLAAITLASNTKSTLLTTIAISLAAIGVPLFDTILAFWRRSARRFTSPQKSGVSMIAIADLDHIHHRLVRSGLSQKKVAVVLYLANFGVVLIGALCMLYQHYAVGILTIAFLISCYAIIKQISKIELWDSGQAILAGIYLPKKRLFRILALPMLDLIFISFSALLSFKLTQTDTSLSTKLFVDTIVTFSCPSLACLFLLRCYQCLWSRARVSEFLYIGLAILVGTLITFAFRGFEEQALSHSNILQTLLFFLTTSFITIGLRMLPRGLEEIMNLKQSKHFSQENVLIYGTSQNSITVARIIENNDSKVNIAGFLEEDISLRGFQAFNYPIFSLHDLDQLIFQKNINKIYYYKVNDEHQKTIASLANHYPSLEIINLEKILNLDQVTNLNVA
jgi:UDP-N-acetylmuramyl pentapeptide phosphotransferase/UDP-N-acetylglucosamine-1-phosphate transferase